MEVGSALFCHHCGSFEGERLEIGKGKKNTRAKKIYLQNHQRREDVHVDRCSFVRPVVFRHQTNKAKEKEGAPALTLEEQDSFLLSSYKRSSSYSLSLTRPALISSMAAHKSKMNSSVKLKAPISDSSMAMAKSLGFFLS